MKMTLNDPLANVLSLIVNHERIGRRECKIHPGSKVIKAVLAVMKDNGYIGDLKETKTTRGSVIELNLIGNINECNVIKPRYSINKSNFEKFEKRYLPAKDFGILIVSTPKGILTHTEAKKKGIGGRLIAYCY